MFKERIRVKQASVEFWQRFSTKIIITYNEVLFTFTPPFITVSKERSANMKRKRIVILAISIFLICFQQLSAEGRNNPGTNREAGRNKPIWTPTSQQNELPPIVITNKNGLSEYSFQSLIEADGYLCPGSARCYMTLYTALPMLFDESEAVMGDFKIVYGPSDCATRVYEFFMDNEYQSEEYLYVDNLYSGREQTVIRISTGAEVRIVYDIPAIDGHTPEGAAAGDLVLHATDGDGMIVSFSPKQ